MNMTVKKLTLLGALTLAFTQTPAFAKVYDATKSFSNKKGANTGTTVWSYSYTNTPAHDGRYTRFKVTGTYFGFFGSTPVSLPAWHNPDETKYFIPDIYANKSPYPLTLPSQNPAYTTYVSPKSLIMRPGYDGIGSVLSFRAPVAGTATIYYSFSHIAWNCATGYGINWSIEQNAGGTPLAQGSLHSVTSTMIASTGVQLLTVAVAKHDRINFIVNSGTPIGQTPTCPAAAATAIISLGP